MLLYFSCSMQKSLLRLVLVSPSCYQTDLRIPKGNRKASLSKCGLLSGWHTTFDSVLFSHVFFRSACCFSNGMGCHLSSRPFFLPFPLFSIHTFRCCSCSSFIISLGLFRKTRFRCLTNGRIQGEGEGKCKKSITIITCLCLKTRRKRGEEETRG